MQNLLLKLYVFTQTMRSAVEAQNLTEYALTVALIALASVAGMSSLATGIDTAFGDVSSSLNSALT
jgi:Flp pilus assembly pilin Flp